MSSHGPRREARIIKDGDTKTKFADVAGCDGAKTELMEALIAYGGETMGDVKIDSYM